MGALMHQVPLLGANLALGIPDLDRIREVLKRIQEILAVGGVTLALLGSLAFLLVWVLSHLRRPSATATHPTLSNVTLYTSYLPVGLTVVAALGFLIPPLNAFVLKAFAFAVLLAAGSWCLSVGTLVAGGSQLDLARARRALLLAGTPWYCLALFLSTYL